MEFITEKNGPNESDLYVMRAELLGNYFGNAPYSREFFSIDAEGQQTGSIAKIEEYKNDSLGIGGIVGHWGIVYPQIKEIDGINFYDLYQTSSEIDVETAKLQEIEVLKYCVSQALAQREWEVKDIDAIVVGSGTPVNDYYAEWLGTLLGIPQRTICQNCYLACNSGGQAFQQALELEGKKTLFVAVDGVSKFLAGAKRREVADEFSLGVFSNGIAVMAFEGGKFFKRISLDSENFGSSGIVEIPDIVATLSADSRRCYRFPGDAGKLIRYGSVLYQHTHTPADGKGLELKPIPTAKFFLSHGGRLLQEAAISFSTTVGRRDFKVICHIPSYALFEGLEKRIHKEFPDVLMPKLIYEGNSSGATTMIQFVRNIPNLMAGEEILIFSFGGGATFSSYGVRVL